MSEIIEEELICLLNEIYNHFGGRENKLEKLYEECGEYRDRYFLDGRSSALTPKKVTEICDIGSCFMQLYINEPLIREGFKAVVLKANKKIREGYYE